MSQRKVAAICQENQKVFGCVWDDALPELGQAYNVEGLTGDEDAIREVFQNTQDPKNVVSNSQENEVESVVFYDPESGEVREMSGRDFWSAWSLGGEYAFTIQP